MMAFLGGKLGRQLASLENSESAGLNILAHQENEWVYLMGNAARFPEDPIFYSGLYSDSAIVSLDPVESADGYI